MQSLENFVSMATQGTQVPKYTKHTLFLYFFDFSISFNLKKKTKVKRIKMLLNMVASVFLRDVRVIGCTSKVIVPIMQL